MVYGGGLAYGSTLEQLGAHLRETYRHCLKGEDENFNSLGKVLTKD